MDAATLDICARAATRVYGAAPPIPEEVRIAVAWAECIASVGVADVSRVEIELVDGTTVHYRYEHGSVNRCLDAALGPDRTFAAPPWPGAWLNARGMGTGSYIKGGQAFLYATAWELWGYAAWLASGQPECNVAAPVWTPPNYLTDTIARLALVERAWEALSPDQLDTVTTQLGRPHRWAQPDVVPLLAELEP